VLTFCINSTRGRGGHESPRWITPLASLIFAPDYHANFTALLGFRILSLFWVASGQKLCNTNYHVKFSSDLEIGQAMHDDRPGARRAGELSRARINMLDG